MDIMSTSRMMRSACLRHARKPCMHRTCGHDTLLSRTLRERIFAFKELQLLVGITQAADRCLHAAKRRQTAA